MNDERYTVPDTKITVVDIIHSQNLTRLFGFNLSNFYSICVNNYGIDIWFDYDYSHIKGIMGIPIKTSLFVMYARLHFILDFKM